MEMDLKKTYYYNNRPVKIIQKTGEAMYLVCANTSGITSEIKAEQFCSACMLGNDVNCTHTCEDVEYLIEEFFDEVSQEDEVFWVHKKTLKETYFEQRANDVLLAEITKMKNEKIDLAKELNFAKQKELAINNDIEKADKELNSFLDLVTKRTKDLHELEEKITEYSADLKDVKIVSDMGISIEISPKEYKKLLTSASRLNALENGGVDNWDWYSESLGDVDYEEEATQIIAKQFKKSLSLKH